MNFIELRVEDFIEEVLDAEPDKYSDQIQILRRFATFLNRETEIFNIQEITEDVALDFLRTVRIPKERSSAVEVLNTFFSYQNGKGYMDKPIHLNLQAVLKSKKSDMIPAPDTFFDGEDDDDFPKHRHRREMEK